MNADEQGEQAITPEVGARDGVHRKVAQVGGMLHEMKTLGLGVASGVVVREFPTDTGPADYVLFVDRQAAGDVEPEYER